jgi:hypothetical protein
MTLQQRRDQLQGSSGGRAASSGISGYSSSDFDTDALAYSGQSQKTNPLASPVYKAPPQPTPATPVWGSWVQGMGNWERDDPLSANDIGRFTSTYAVQGGLDRTWQGLKAADDALVVGIVSSWTNSHVTYDNTPTTLRLEGPGVGVYSTYIKGGFSTDLTTKFDFLQMLQDYAGAAPNASVGITNAGVSGNLQYKFTFAKNDFLEPTAGFSFTRTIFGSAPGLDLQDSSTLRLQAGARLGTTWEVNGISVDSSLKALVYGNAIVTGTSITASVLGSAAITPTDQGLVRGELDPSMSFNLADGYSVTLSGSVLFGPAILGGSGALNLRKQF